MGIAHGGAKRKCPACIQCRQEMLSVSTLPRTVPAKHSMRVVRASDWSWRLASHGSRMLLGLPAGVVFQPVSWLIVRRSAPRLLGEHPSSAKLFIQAQSLGISIEHVLGKARGYPENGFRGHARAQHRLD